MRVLLVGGGGREHALAWKIAQSPLLSQLLIAPGNAGTAAFGQNVPVSTRDIDGLLALARAEQVALMVVGPDNPLADGLVDRSLDAGIPAFGPTAAAAQLESSKSFTRALLAEAGVPGPAYHVFDAAEAAAEFVRASGQPWVVKADGLALGKGVVVADSVAQTVEAIAQLAATAAGQRLVLEERLVGRELSLLALCDGERLLPLPPARDYKRLGDNDQGPNTGGMGAIAPVEIAADTFEGIVDRCLRPVVRALAARGTPFVGALYAGLMLTEQGPQVLEFNARFGDPETQVLLPLLEGDLLAALLACAQGNLDPQMLQWRNATAACVVLAAEGYPATPRLGDPIAGLETLTNYQDLLVFHAGTDWQNGAIVTNGGRVLGVTALQPTLSEAVAAAYAAIEDLQFAGMQFRRDIGT